jgi:energy-coupling factor transporter ATP-binding protein EcfA2
MKQQPNMPKPEPVPDLYDSPLAQTFEMLMVAVPVTMVAGLVAAGILYRKNWRGTFALVAAAPAIVVALFVPLAWCSVAACVIAGVLRERWRYEEIKKGHEKLRRGKAAIGPVTYWRNWRDRRRVSAGEFFRGEAYAAGEDRSGGIVRLPLGLTQGRHTLLIGTTGSGKTTSMLNTAMSYLDAGAGVIAIDAKGSPELVTYLRDAAAVTGRAFFHFNLDGNGSDQWNPLAYGTPSERADKLIAAEEWTEPHYKRLYQRYLLTIFTAIDGRGDTPDLATVVQLLHPTRLTLYAREINEPRAAQQLDGYLADLTDQEKHDLAGLRNRLAILAESEHGDLLTPTGDPANHIDLLAAIQSGAVVVFSINTSRYPETGKLLGAAILQDLQSVAGFLEANPSLRKPTAILVDEFGAFGADHIIGLFQRARSVWLSLTVATQELADLRRIDPAFQDQVIGNVETVIAHSQNVPDSAELVAKIAGTREVWIHTFQTDQAITNAPDLVPSGLGTKRLGQEFYVAPDTIKQLAVGEAVVITKHPYRVVPTMMLEPRVLRPEESPWVNSQTALRRRALATVRPDARADRIAGNGATAEA